jgi:hypothetical protein
MHDKTMALPEDLRRLIQAMERNLITSGEFFGKIWTRLSNLPSAEKKVLLEELLAHPDEDVRDAAKECGLMMHHGELSKNLDYIQQNSPLRRGVSMELFGGYDYYSSGGKPLWLNGRDCYNATFLGFASFGENTIPVALVKLDDFVELPPHKGSFAILRATYASDSFAWGKPEGTPVEVHVMEALPEDLTSIRSRLTSAFATETHATYRIRATT